MKLALGLDVQTNAKGGKFMSIEDSHQGALVCKADVEVLWEPGNFQDNGAKRVGVCFASNDLGAWTDGVEQAVVDDMIIFQKPFPGVTRAELESQLQRAVNVKCKMDLERCLRRQPRAAPRGVRAPQGPRACGGPARVADGQAVGRALRGAPPYAGAPGGAVLPVLGFQQLGACGPRGAHVQVSVRWQESRRTRLWRVSPWQLA